MNTRSCKHATVFINFTSPEIQLRAVWIFAHYILQENIAVWSRLVRILFSLFIASQFVEQFDNFLIAQKPRIKSCHFSFVSPIWWRILKQASLQNNPPNVRTNNDANFEQINRHRVLISAPHHAKSNSTVKNKAAEMITGGQASSCSFGYKRRHQLDCFLFCFFAERVNTWGCECVCRSSR